MSDAGGLPDDEVTPQDIVSHASGVNPTASKAFIQAARKAYIKTARKHARQEAEMAFLKKKMEMELALADIEAEEQQARARAAVKKAERDKRRRRAELVIQQANLESEQTRFRKSHHE